MQMPRMVAIGLIAILGATAVAQQPFRAASTNASAESPFQMFGTLAIAHADNRVEQIPYRPQPGDLCLCDTNKKIRHVLFKLSGTAPPTHVSLVIAGRDGKPALMEFTGNSVVFAKISVVPLEDGLHDYPGDVMVRRLRQPLTAEQSRALTEFAYAQEGKQFAVGRVMLQITPFNPHTGLRRAMFGKTHYDRKRWFCSEVVVAAGAKAQIFDPNRVFSNATYPRDLAFDETIDLSDIYYTPVLWSPTRNR